jgi:hypothetical protein
VQDPLDRRDDSLPAAVVVGIEALRRNEVVVVVKMWGQRTNCSHYALCNANPNLVVLEKESSELNYATRLRSIRRTKLHIYEVLPGNCSVQPHFWHCVV